MTWTPTDTVGANWGQIRVMVANKDVTWFRDVETKVQSWQHADPYGPLDATIVFPQVTQLDHLEGDPALAWLKEGASVRIERVSAAGVVINPRNPLFHGLIDSVQIDDTVTVTCKGQFSGRWAIYQHQPTITARDSVDAGTRIFRLVDRIGVDLYPHKGLHTGIKVQARGSRDMTLLGMIDHILGLAMTEDGDSVTLLPDPTKGLNAIRMQWRAMKSTPDVTVDAGARGVKVSLRRDLVDMTTAVWGEGVSPSGERWRNAKYPNLGNRKTVPTYHGPYSLGSTHPDMVPMIIELWGNGDISDHGENLTVFDEVIERGVRDTQREAGLPVTGVVNLATWKAIFSDEPGHQSFVGGFFAPLAANPKGRYWRRAGDGTVIGRNPAYDPKLPQVHQFIGYGEGVTKAQARANAQHIVNRGLTWSGTVTLVSDPAEMSKLDIRAGMTLKINHHGGTAGRKVYISSVQVDWANPQHPVTLAVSTTARHYLDLLTLTQRRMEARQDPAKQWRHQLRRSAATSDALIGWEGESGAGVIRHTSLGRGWNVFPMVAAELGTIGSLRLSTSPNRPWIMGMFAHRVSERALQNRLGNPFRWHNAGKDDQESVWTHHAKWLVGDQRLLVEAWGDPDQPCGYWPHQHTNAKGKDSTFAPTGNFRDDGSWDFATKSGFLWVAVYVQDPCHISGRAKISINDAP